MAKSIRNRTTSQAIDDFIKVHGDRYDYSKFEYKNNRTKSTIICHKHGEFEQRYINHIDGRGCQKCGKEQCDISSRKSTEYIKNKMIEKHGNNYDYSLMKYVSSKDKVSVICSLHGEFLILPHDHISGKGCWHCGNLKKRYGVGMSIEKFKKASNILNNGISTFYIIKCFDENECFYKIGITNYKLDKRFKSYSSLPYNRTEMVTIEAKSEDVYKCETSILKDCENPYKPKKSFCGDSECILEICENTIRNIKEFLGVDYGLEKRTN